MFSANAATVNGLVTDSSGTAIDSAIVTLTPIAGGATLRDTTDATGAYIFTGVAAGTYRITAAKTGYNTLAPSFLNVPAANSVVAQNLELTKAGAGITISGNVTNATGGAGIVGAIVRLRLAGVVVDSATTIAGGAYTLSAVQPGTYTINVTATGFTAQTSGAIVVAAANLTRNYQLVPIAAGVTISGTVTAAVGGTAIVGAIVRLRQFGVVIDSATTVAGGAYTLDSVRAGTYTLNVTAAGYIAQTTGNITVAAANVTRNFQLAVQPAGVTISGTVTDATDQSGIGGAVLRLRQNGVVIDSAVTTDAGGYSFDSVQAGTYTINITADGYIAQTTGNITVATTALTRNFQLVAMPTGNLYVLVRTSATGNAAIPGATVAATPTFVGGTTLTGTTGTTGYAGFPGCLSGIYNVTASAAGFTANTVRHTVPATVKDTLVITLTPSTTGTKVLKGVVTDTANQAKLAHVEIVLTITGGGAGTLTFFDSTDANGAFLITGIPTNVGFAGGTVVATLTGYDTHTNARVALGANGTADTTTLNIAMTKVGTAVNPIARSIVSNGKPSFRFTRGFLRLSNINDAGVARVFSMNGRLLFQTRFSAHSTTLAIPGYAARSGGMYIVSISQKNTIYRGQIMMP
jgi:hypothetical protein